MNRNELLEWMKPRISEYYYEILELWVKEDSKISAGTKFSIKPSICGIGYIVWSKNWWSSDYLIVYKD